jgi:hypothetical protein
LATQIDAVTQQSNVPLQIANLLRTRCALALRDLVTTAPNVRDAPYAGATIWLEPTIIDFGWLGSDINSAMLRGCIWAWLTLALTSAPAITQTTRGIVVLQDAHTLFGSVADRSSSSSVSISPLVTPTLPLVMQPIAALAQNITRAGVGTMLVDDRPDLLDVEVISKACMTILTSNANMLAQDHAAALIGASPRQRIRMHRLNPMEAVVAMRGSIPMLIGL